MTRLTSSSGACIGFIIACILACGCSRKSAESPNIAGDSKAGGSSQGADAGKHSGTESNAPADNGAILAAVRQNIQSDSRIKIKQIQVSYEHGTIKLKGKVGTDDELLFAGNDALKVDGVQGVANCLSGERYKGSPAQPLPAGYEAVVDSLVRAIQFAKVRGKIQIIFDPPDPTIKGPGTGNGTIHLAGFVEDPDQYIAAMNNVLKLTDLPILDTVSVLHDPTDPLRWSISQPSTAASWKESSSADKPAIPLCPGLTVVTAIAAPEGDYESIKTIESVDSTQVRLRYSAEVMPPWWEAPHPQIQKTVTHRVVLVRDLDSAHNYDYIFSERAPETALGATAIGTSAAMLRELKTNGEAELGLCGGDDDHPILDKDGQVKPLTTGCTVSYEKTIKRLESEPVLLRVLVNGVPTDLPAVHAMGQWGADRRNEFFFLDDERNPLTLKYRMGIGLVPALRPNDRELCNNARTKGQYVSVTGDDPPSCDLPDGGDRDTLRVVKITTECGGEVKSSSGGPPHDATALEQSLAQDGKADIYSVYFSFNSDVIRDESEPTLKEIAQVMRRHGDWKLRIAGHTDGIGNDDNNLDLSKRRSSAVKNALVKRYKIEEARLSTTGFGKSQPKDTNATLEGRAHNRRVELMRIP